MIILAMTYEELNQNLNSLDTLFERLKSRRISNRLFISIETPNYYDIMERLISWRFCIPTTFSLQSSDSEKCLYQSGLVKALLRSEKSVVLTTNQSLLEQSNYKTVTTLIGLKCPVFKIGESNLDDIVSHMEDLQYARGV